MKYTASHLLLIGSLLVALPGQAATNDPASSYYFGFGLGSSSVSSKQYQDSNDISFNTNAGYHFNGNIAAEVFVQTLSFRFADGIIGDHSYYPDNHVGVAVLGSFPIAQHIKPYGRLGIGSTRMASADVHAASHHSFDPTVGIGVGYAFTNHVALKLEATRFTKSEVTTVTAAMEFSF